MALFRDEGERTEPATPRKREETRRKGQVALSTELSMAALLLTAAVLVQALGGPLLDSLSATAAWGLGLKAPAPSDPREAGALLLAAATPAAPWVLAFVGVLACVALAASYGQVGFRFAPARLAPEGKKINPIAGLERMLRGDGVVRLVASILKLAALGGVLWLVVRSRRAELASMAELGVIQSAGILVETVLIVLWWTAGVLLVISFIDVIYQRFRHEKSIRMSRKEVDDERKRTEGDPHVKARIRRVQREMAKHRMMAEVPKADVIITNPVHYAVAVRYRRGAMEAPVVAAKGAGEAARRIRLLALEAGVPIVEEPPLARALFQGVGLGEEIPPRFYRAVAAILSHVYRLKQARGEGAPHAV